MSVRKAHVRASVLFGVSCLGSEGLRKIRLERQEEEEEERWRLRGGSRMVERSKEGGRSTGEMDRSREQEVRMGGEGERELTVVERTRTLFHLFISID